MTRSASVTLSSADVEAIARTMLALMREEQATAAPAPEPKAPAKAKAKAATTPATATPKGSAVRHDSTGWWLVGEADVPAHCTGLRADGTGRCGQTEGLDADGRCPTHRIALGGQAAPKGLIGRRFARAIRKSERLAKPAEAKSTAKPKASTADTAAKPQRTSVEGVTCKGRTKSGAACGRWVGLDEHGYCKAHGDQYRPKAGAARTVRVKADAAIPMPSGILRADDV